MTKVYTEWSLHITKFIITKFMFINIRLYNRKVYMYLTLYVTVLTVKYLSIITEYIYPPPKRYGSNINEFQSTEIITPKNIKVTPEIWGT
jgi:predicted membrane protein